MHKTELFLSFNCPSFPISFSVKCFWNLSCSSAFKKFFKCNGKKWGFRVSFGNSMGLDLAHENNEFKYRYYFGPCKKN